MGKKDNQNHRRKGKDKAKQTFEKYGKYTNKHIRLMETLEEKRKPSTLKEPLKKQNIKKEI